MGGVALDNVVWNALTGPQARFAERRALAARYQPDVAPFGALPDEPDDSAWTAMRELVGPGNAAMLFGVDVAHPPGWKVLFELEGLQMVAEDARGEPSADAIVLGVADVTDIKELIALAQPGPWGDRTYELGRYAGIRVDGQLVAMAGERMRCEGYTEVSAVCTHPDHRGRGYAAAMVRDVIAAITGRGDLACLHVVATNTPAINLYESLGFTTRRTITARVYEAPR
jgi:ribosomal protein S18 acetylase RimI-like enzyme